jgi:hypothetical protein
MAQEKNCPNYNDIVSFLAEPKDQTELNRNIDRIGDCTECAEAGVCGLWVTCLFIDDLAPRLGLPPKEIGINDLDDYMDKIALALVKRKDFVRHQDIAGSKRVFPLKYFENFIPLRAQNNNNYIRSNLQKAFDAFHQEDYETAVLLFRMLLTEYNKFEDFNLYAAISYFFEGDYENAVTFMNYYSEKTCSYDRVMGNAFIDLCCDKMKFNLGK